MKSVKRRFERFQRESPNLCSIINFSYAVNGQGFSRDKIKRNFEILVEKEDYQPSDKIRLMEYFINHTNPFLEPVAYEKQGKFRSGGACYVPVVANDLPIKIATLETKTSFAGVDIKTKNHDYAF